MTTSGPMKPCAAVHAVVPDNVVRSRAISVVRAISAEPRSLSGPKRRGGADEDVRLEKLVRSRDRSECRQCRAQLVRW